MDTTTIESASSRRPELGLVVGFPLSVHCGDYLDINSLQSNEDSVYEQDIIREPASIKPWLAYIEFKSKHGSLLEQAFVMERACSQLPRSYKLWKLVGGHSSMLFLNVN